MVSQIRHIISLFEGKRLSLTVEKDLQNEIEVLFQKADLPHKREYRLDEKNIPDFFIPGGIAVEAKLKGSKKNIYRQCERYCAFDQVKALILVTNKSMGLPKEIHGKPCYIVKLSLAWL